MKGPIRVAHHPGASASISLIQTLAAKQVGLSCRALVASTVPDRAALALTTEVLDRIKATLPGKALCWSHQWYDLPIGTVTEAWIAEAEILGQTVPCLHAGFHVPATPGTQEIRELIETNTISYCSVSFSCDAIVCSICGGRWWQCEHDPGHTYDGILATRLIGGRLEAIEATELSLCYLGQQYGARILAVEKSGASGAAPEDTEMVAVGRRYVEQLRGEVCRMARLLGTALPSCVLRSVDHLNVGELEELEKQLLTQLNHRLPSQPSQADAGSALFLPVDAIRF